MTTERHIAVMGLMNDIEAPAKTYRSALRKAWRTATDSPENSAAKAKGNAALLEIEAIVRQWIAAHPQTQTDQRTPCSIPECDVDGTGEPCSRHEREDSHVEGNHELCGTECAAAAEVSA